MRIAFLGSPPFAVPILERILASEHEPCVLVTRPERPRGRGRRVESSPLVDLARERGIPVLEPASARDEAFRAELASFEPELLLVASYGQILDQALLDLAPRGAFNVHASLLPRHRGASPIQAAIRAGDERTGVSVQRMVLALDQGDVLLALDTPIGERESAGELLQRLAKLGGEAAVQALDLIERGAARFVPQDPTRATYAPRLRKEDGRIDWRLGARELERHVRAMTPWPGALAKLAAGPELVVVEALAHPELELASALPGELLAAQQRLLVATGAGALEILRLTPAGKRSLSAAEWLRGARLAPSARFEVQP